MKIEKFRPGTKARIIVRAGTEELWVVTFNDDSRIGYCRFINPINGPLIFNNIIKGTVMKGLWDRCE